MRLTIDNRISFDLSRVTPATRDRIKALAEFPNPAYKQAQIRGYSTYGIPKVISEWRTKGNFVFLPRGVGRKVCNILAEAGIPLEFQTNTVSNPWEWALPFKGQLRPDQEQVVERLLKSHFGVLRAPTGSGKTVIAIYLVSQRKENTLVLVHTKELLDQWRQRISDFLGVKAGIIGGGIYKPGNSITVALYQSAIKYLPDLTQSTGFLVVDECHRAPSSMFSKIVQAFPSKYALGLSATPYRRDGLTPLIEWYVGPEIFSIDPVTLQEMGHILAAKLTVRNTSFFTDYGKDEYSKILSEISKDEERNYQIAKDAIQMAKEGHQVLILTDRVAHVDRLEKLISSSGVSCASLVGSYNKDQRTSTVEAVRSGIYKILVATGQLIGEGFDCPNLSCLILAMPIKFEGRLIQYVGRILRKSNNKIKPVVVIDYCDGKVPVLTAQFRSRLRVYKKHGIKEG